MKSVFVSNVANDRETPLLPPTATLNRREDREHAEGPNRTTQPGYVRDMRGYSDGADEQPLLPLMWSKGG